MVEQSYRTLIKQEHSELKITHPLEADLFNVRRIEVQESFDAPYQIIVDVISTDPAIDYHDLIGQEIGLSAAFGDGTRYFHGVMIEFENTSTPHFADRDVTTYRMVVVPKLWLLKLTQECKVYQEKTVLDIVQDIFSAHQNYGYRSQLSASR